MEALGINLGYLVLYILNFIILVLVMKMWAYDPILKVLETRKEKIAQGLEDARKAQEARANAKTDAEKLLKEAQAEAAQKAASLIQEAQKAAADIRTAANGEREKILAQAEIDAGAARNAALSEVRDQIATLAIAAANKIVGDSLDEKRQQVLITEFFSGIKGSKVVVLDDTELSGTSAEVTSALPLTTRQQSTIKKDLARQLGTGAEVNFRVDPNILGGLVVQVGDKIVDGSARGRLESLRQSLA